MAKFFYIFILIILTVYGQENAARSVSPSLRECYENKYLLQRDNRLPHTLNTFLALLRKIENAPDLNMDLRRLSVTLLHRFRQDGIILNPAIPVQDGVTPYAPLAPQFFRHAQTLRLIPGNAISFPNNSLTDIERCTLHFMISSSIEIYQRENEAKECKFSNAYRYRRDADDDKMTSDSTIGDVETLSSDEIKTMSNRKDDQVTADPNSQYPELPPNHPDAAKYIAPSAPISKCPLENGIIKTPWGVVSPGLVLAGTAAATEPSIVPLLNLQPDILQSNFSELSKTPVDNKWFATLAGDLAEVAVIQGVSKKFSVGATGDWNSTALPRWYFLHSNEQLEMTTAEIRGDLDGLILANEINKWYSKISSLKLSQILDMYYSAQGFFDPTIRACNRRTLFTAVAPNETMTAQTYAAALLLNNDISVVTIEPSTIQKFVVQAVNELAVYVPSSMNEDLSCANTDKFNDFNHVSVDLTIILDTNWRFSEIQPILATLLDNIEVNQYNSNFTVLNGYDGTPIINSTFSILDFYAYNSSHYDNITHGFKLAESLDALELRLINKLDRERSRGVGGARSDVVLILPSLSASISPADKDYSSQVIHKMREQFPDTTLLIMTRGSKDIWSDLVRNSARDLFSISYTADTEEALAPIAALVSRIKQVPKRLINSQCGSDYVSNGSPNSYTDYIVPNGVNFHKLHANYFFHHENSATLKIQGSGSDTLIVCWSRDELHVNATRSSSEICATVIGGATHSISVGCADATFISDCPPLYISVNCNTTGVSYDCTGSDCRFPYMRKYTISYENVVCTSSTSKIAFSSLMLFILLGFLNL